MYGLKPVPFKKPTSRNFVKAAAKFPNRAQYTA
jgi:hypothetical protein